MQSDYISRQAAVDEIREMSPELFSVYQHNVYIDKQGTMIRIMAMPSADVVPVVYGKWIRGKYTGDDLRYNDYSYRCNRCGKIVGFEENYCPKCGAKMDGGKS